MRYSPNKHPLACASSRHLLQESLFLKWYFTHMCPCWIFFTCQLLHNTIIFVHLYFFCPTIYCLVIVKFIYMCWFSSPIIQHAIVHHQCTLFHVAQTPIFKEMKNMVALFSFCFVSSLGSAKYYLFIPLFYL